MKKKFFIFLCIFISFFRISSTQEGFLENTLVVTPTGYQNIQDLCVGDLIYNEHGQEKIITNTYEYLTDQYLQIDINHEIINCALDQQLYVPLYQSWIKACDLTEQECNSIKIIQKSALIYCLTVQDHTFQISNHNIIAHNSAAALIAPSIILSFIQLAQPVLILLGATASLYYLNSHNPAREQNNTFIYQPSHEKNYFDTRSQKLCKLKEEFLSIHTSVKSIKCQFQDQHTLLSYQQLFNKNFTPTFNISAQQEADLDFEQRLQLTEIRKKILQDLEDEICNIQISVGLFINEIVTRKNETVIAYNRFIQENKNRTYQQATLSCHLSSDIAAQYYEHVMSCMMFIAEIEDRTKECRLLIELFKQHQSNEIITQTTNIIPALTQEKANIEKSQATIDRTKQDNQKKLQAAHIYFYNHPPLPDIAHKVTLLQQELHQKLHNNAKERFQTQTYPCIKPPQFEDDDDAPRYYEKSPKHPDYYNIEQAEQYLAKCISPSPQNGQLALDKSIKLKNGARAAIQNYYIVIFYRTRLLPEGGSIYHGFITTYELMKKRPHTAEFINILKKANLLTSAGKIQ